MDGEWTEARRRRWKQLSRRGDRPRWNHDGVTSMFVSNLPSEIKKESLKNFFAKFGEVVDVYMPLKKDANKKSFAFVRFKKVGDDLELEKSQGIKFGGRTMIINIAKFERKSACVSSDRRNVINRTHSRIPPVSSFSVTDNRSFADVAAGGCSSARIPPPPPPLNSVPIRLSDDSPMREWMNCNHTLIGELHSFDHLEQAPFSLKNNDGSGCEIKYLGGLRIGVTFSDRASSDTFRKRWSEWFRGADSDIEQVTNFDRIAWIKITGLPPELWSEKNFMSIAKSYGRVFVPFTVDQSAVNLSFGKIGILTSALSCISSEPMVEVNGKIIKIGISEVDFDWTPFKQLKRPHDVSSSSDDDGEDDVEDEGEDGISDTILNQGNIMDLEDGEIRSTDVEVVSDSNSVNSSSKKHDYDRSSAAASSPADVVMDMGDRKHSSDIHEDIHGLGVGNDVHGIPQHALHILDNNDDNYVGTHATPFSEPPLIGAEKVNVKTE